MGEPKWTPWPWGIEFTNERMWIGPLRKDGSGKVKEIVSWFDLWNLKDDAILRNKGNAHLIAAAPDLYKALEKVQDAVRRYGLPRIDTQESDIAQSLVDAHAALAKARGES